MDKSTEAKAMTQKNMKHSAWLDHKIPAPKDEVERNIRLGMLSFQAQSGLCSVDNEETLDRTSFKLYLLVFFLVGVFEHVCMSLCVCLGACACMRVCVLVHAHEKIKR